jgi:predicted metal-dependent peptidase
MSPDLYDKYFSLEDIKIMFSEYRNIKYSNLSIEEFDLLCDWLHFLPKKVVIEINNEIYFVLLGAKKFNFACYVSLDNLPKGKKAIICISPLAFSSQLPELTEKAKKEILFRVLHEVAHHTKGHIEYKDQKHKEIIEREADAQVNNWLDDWHSWHLNNE